MLLSSKEKTTSFIFDSDFVLFILKAFLTQGQFLNFSSTCRKLRTMILTMSRSLKVIDKYFGEYQLDSWRLLSLIDAMPNMGQIEFMWKSMTTPWILDQAETRLISHLKNGVQFARFEFEFTQLVSVSIYKKGIQILFDLGILSSISSLRILVPSSIVCDQIVQNLHLCSNSLLELNLRSSTLCDEGIRQFASHLCKLPKLKLLDLDENGITSEGFSYLCELFQQDYFPSLEKLFIGGNFLTSDDMTLLSRVLTHEPTIMGSLSHLYIEFNNIGDEGLERLSEFFFMDCANVPQFVNLSYNGITTYGIRRLIQKFERYTPEPHSNSKIKLKKLNLSYNTIDAQITKKLRNALERHQIELIT